MTSDPEIIRHMNAAKHKHKKSSWYASLKLDPYVHSIFSETNIQKHDELRVNMQAGVCYPIVPLMPTDLFTDQY